MSLDGIHSGAVLGKGHNGLYQNAVSTNDGVVVVGDPGLEPLATAPIPSGMTRFAQFRADQGLTSTEWTSSVGSPIVLVGNGSPTIVTGEPISGGTSVSFDGINDYYVTASTIFTPVATEDLVLRLLFRKGANGFAFGARNSSGAYPFDFRMTAGGIAIDRNDGTSTATRSAPALGPNTWNYAEAYIDRNSRMILYMNGTSISPTNIAGFADITTSTVLIMGAFATPNFFFNGRVAYAEVIRGPAGSVSTTLADNLALHQEAFSRIVIS